MKVFLLNVCMSDDTTDTSVEVAASVESYVRRFDSNATVSATEYPQPLFENGLVSCTGGTYNPDWDEHEDDILPSEALMGFIGWLTTRKEKVTISSKNDPSTVISLLEEFIKVNNWCEPRENWYENIVSPEAERLVKEEQQRMAAFTRPKASTTKEEVLPPPMFASDPVHALSQNIVPDTFTEIEPLPTGDDSVDYPELEA